ncbi:hypothetical protein QFZ88_003829 [Mesorhizobium sp. YL-MeA3-2017]|nr:hypothetical protein [Mesorhizobium sp. YL-MeA3-2017]
MVAELAAEMECRRLGGIDQNAVAHIQCALPAAVLHTAPTFELHKQEKLFDGIAPNIVPVMIDAVEIVGDVRKFHAAGIDAAGLATNVETCIHGAGSETPASGVQIVDPAAERRPYPVLVEQFRRAQ